MHGPGLRAGFDTAVVLTRWMFPYIGFMSMVALAAGILNTWKRFAVPAADAGAAEPERDRRGLVAARRVLAAAGIEPIYALAVGVMVGGVLQLAVQVPALAAHRRAAAHRPAALGAVARPGATPACARVLRQMAPALLGVSVAQISLLINTQIASHVGGGRGVVADLCRPADGVPDRAARRGAGRGAAAAAVGGAGAAGRRSAYSEHARLGPAPGAAAGAALRGGAAGVSGRRWSRCCTTTAPSAPPTSR